LNEVSMSPLRMVYLALAVLGAALPGGNLLALRAAPGLQDGKLLAAWLDGPATQVLAWNVMVAASALVIWIVAETRVRRNWSALWAIPATGLIGPGCGLPLYLFLRTRKVA
jgi:hypothetical protein